MEHQRLDISNLENKLKKQAKDFLETTRQAKINNYNSESILLRLTGRRYSELTSRKQIFDAEASVETALLSERKKARLKRYDYDLNRHIALHQAKKSLASKARQLDVLR